MKIFIILVAVFGVSFAELAYFTKCRESVDDVCQVNEVRITPCTGRKTCKLTKTKQTKIEFDFVPKFDAANFTTSLFWASPTGDKPFDALHNVDACPFTTCPSQANNVQQFNYNLLLSKMLPTGTYMLKWKLWNKDDDTKVCCFKTEIKLKDPPRSRRT